MADNSPQGGTDSIRDIDKGGVKTQVVTLDLGGAGAESLVSGSIPVTGTFWQLTQPVSGPLTDTELRAVAVPVSGTFWQATQPVSGTVAVSNSTFPVTDNSGSLTVDAPVATPVFVRLSDGAVAIAALPVTDNAGSLTVDNGGTFAVQATLAAETTKVIGTVNVAASQTIGVTQATGTNLHSVVDAITPPTLTKATQGATGFSVQNLRDAGRTLCSFTASAVGTVTSEALITLTPYKDLSAGSTATTFAVTSGKRLRLQSLVLTVRCTSTVNVGGIVRFRMLAGTVLVGSPVHISVGGQGSNLATAVIGNSMSYFVDFPEGFELSGTMQFGLTQLFSATTATIDVHVLGYEF